MERQGAADAVTETETEAAEGAPLSIEHRKDLLKGVLSRTSGGEDERTDEAAECAGSEEELTGSGLSAVPVVPEADYSDSEEENRQARANCHLPAGEDGLIKPRKLVNPCLASADRRELHRELKFNQKTGKNVLNQKSELQKEMERRQEKQQRRQAQLSAQANKNSFERALEERLQRIEAPLKIVDDSQTNCDVTPEFLKVHAKVRANINTPS